mgnify:CR=1 FL=1
MVNLLILLNTFLSKDQTDVASNTHMMGFDKKYKQLGCFVKSVQSKQ